MTTPESVNATVDPTENETNCGQEIFDLWSGNEQNPGPKHLASIIATHTRVADANGILHDAKWWKDQCNQLEKALDLKLDLLPSGLSTGQSKRLENQLSTLQASLQKLTEQRNGLAVLVNDHTDILCPDVVRRKELAVAIARAKAQAEVCEAARLWVKSYVEIYLDPDRYKETLKVALAKLAAIEEKEGK